MAIHTRPNAIDLFAGAGGMSLGFEQAGFDIKAAVEIDPVHAAVHEFNFPRCATICAGVETLTGERIRELAHLGSVEIDAVIGGAPCQGFSMIGKRALDDPRNRLVEHFVRLVVELRANYFVFENVRGLTLGAHRKFLDELIELFKANEYDVREPYEVLNAANFEVPQDRRRLFLLGCRKGLTLPRYPMPTGKTTVDEALRDLPNADDYAELLNCDSAKVRFHEASRYGRQLRALEMDKTDYSYPRIYDKSKITSSLRTEHTKLSQSRFHATPNGQVEKVSRFLKLDPDGVCNTLRAGTDSARGAFTSPRPIHPNFARVITVREAARLHSYPDWFRFHATKWHGFRQIGNSVPPLLARSVAKQVLKSIGSSPTKPSEPIALGSETLLNLNMAGASKWFALEKVPISTRIRQLAPNDAQLRLHSAGEIHV